eukprot:CAMPEP_0117027978 /NCGR_PEP_ID=MMETSP0472-20121206/20384_1 /TAXON_ID=693140 ORGANISM="Tiarina fusus, Strain LIS" /NCGR_SAMPLE_ID=MMETSP0472 /ASSEMBLY_ACC=CAM_ASM_000603 /LENGTH=538 /DNA_ID=CAMNT_0004735339 /DNA_START=257 /DNA_END=1873 /DNA_ORIENTATION=+
MTSFLSHASPEIVQFAGRAIGNFSYQDEKNRNLLVELNVPFKLVELLRETTDTTIQKNLSGALANVSFVSDGLQLSLVEKGIIPILMKQLVSSEELVVVMTIRAIANIFDETTCDAFRESECMSIITSLVFTNESALVRSDALTTVGTLTENNEDDLVNFINDGDNLSKIHRLAKEDPDEQVRADAWNFLSSLAENDVTKPVFDKKNVLAQLMKDVKQTTTDGEKQDEQVVDQLSSALQVLGRLAAHDDCMDTIFQLFSVFINLAKHEDANVKTYTAMILGNISRKDEYCIRLVEAGAVPILKELCMEDTRIKHLALSAVRNIAIPEVNKTVVIDQEGLLEAVNKCLTESNNAHVLFNAVLVMKTLASGGEAFVDKMFKANTIQDFHTLLERKLEEGQERIHFEAARFFVLIGNVNEEKLKLVMENGCLQGLALLLSSGFTLLHSEALSIISKIVGDENYRKQMVEAGFVEELIRLLLRQDIKEDEKRMYEDLQICILSALNIFQQNEKAKQTIQAAQETLLPLKQNEKLCAAVTQLE